MLWITGQFERRLRAKTPEGRLEQAKEEISIQQDDGAEKGESELRRRRQRPKPGHLTQEGKGAGEPNDRRRNQGRRRQVRIRREAGRVVYILREGRKIEAIATVPGIDLPLVGVGFLPALFGAGIGGFAVPLEILLQTCIPLGAEAPGQTLCIA